MVCIYVQHAMRNYHQDTILYQHGSRTELCAYGEEHYQEGISSDSSIEYTMQPNNDCVYAMNGQLIKIQICNSIAAKQQLVDLTGDETSTPTSSAASPMTL